MRVRIADLKRLALFFLERAALIDPELHGEISIALLDDDGMRELNKLFLGRNATTDVLSFRYGRQSGQPETIAGECIINAQRALHLGPRHGGAARELALYLAHACDHLAGEEDDNEQRRRRMRRRELRWLREAKNRNLLNEDMIRI